ncbi:MAG: hypothetical protein AAF447_10590 [Myxococcota bacterium]
MVETHPESPPPSRWAHLRAGAVAVLVFVHLCQGAPRPRVSAESAAKPAAARQIQAWSGRLGLTPEELRAHLIGLSEASEELRQAVSGPFWKVFWRLGFEQRWALFSGSRKRTWRMYIEWRDAEGWHLAYRVQDPEHRWNARQLDYRRIRGVWNPGADEARVDYGRFADWVGRRLCEDRESAAEVRVRFARVLPPPPGGAPHVEDEFGLEARRTCARGAAR